MTQHWQHRIGSQRDWVWRGWQTRYTYIRVSQPSQITTPVLLLHGFGASIGHWRHNLGVLSQSHTVYALDMLGFGASRKAQANYKVDLWVEQVYDFWRTFIQQPVVLVGNSIGSLVALAAAAAHPEMVQGFVMMSLPDPTMEEEATPKFLRPLVASVKGVVASPLVLKNVFSVVKRPSFVRKWASLAYSNPEAITDELVDILAGPAQDRGSAAAFCAIFKAMTGTQFGPSVTKLLPTLNVPMLLIWGRKDKMIPYSLVHRFNNLNARLQLVEVDAGHCPHDECPDEVNQLILDWLETLATSKTDSTTPQKQLTARE
ncbi:MULTISPECIES: alpha/beta fold hydrolase [Cyanophyceae]|uniref:alpha/beta fold hydrolase n=1 Tax=Cyanophyceae TaxID=3028117 RepID=UPI001689942A|nr:alpha/beta fold hydrolase [Trichocoleus sp. FACHB-69]MBD1930935.1 alpha/beta fold hydrolase [Trichocoleus sp. FACHB-69]